MTGYTHEMWEKKMGFMEFACLCARNFGATVTMRDEPFDAQIPDEFKPDTYYRDKIASLRVRIAELEGMSESQRLAHGERLKRQQIDQQLTYIAECEAKAAFMRPVLAKAEAWEPPSADHYGMKRFMIEQLTDSIRSETAEYTRAGLERSRGMTALEFFNEDLSRAKSDLEYSIEENVKEIERTNGRNRWIRQLRESLK